MNRICFLATPRRGSVLSWESQAGVIVRELELTAMQPCDRRGEAQARAAAGLRAALLEPHEALDHAAAIGLRNAGAALWTRSLSNGYGGQSSTRTFT